MNHQKYKEDFLATHIYGKLPVQLYIFVFYDDLGREHWNDAGPTDIGGSVQTFSEGGRRLPVCRRFLAKPLKSTPHQSRRNNSLGMQLEKMQIFSPRSSSNVEQRENKSVCVTLMTRLGFTPS